MYFSEKTILIIPLSLLLWLWFDILLWSQPDTWHFFFGVVWCEVLCCGDSQDGLQVVISGTTSVCCFVNIHHWEELLTQICAPKHAQGMEWMNCAGPAVPYFAFSVPLHCSSISSIWICAGAVSTSTANGLQSNSKLFLFVLQSH